MCRLTNLSRSEIEQIMNEFLYYKGIHSFLNDLKKQGKPLPQSQIQMQTMITEQKPEFLKELQLNMYHSIRKILGYSNRYLKRQEEKKQRENSKKRIYTYKL
jgi:hypothetical protein